MPFCKYFYVNVLLKDSVHASMKEKIYKVNVSNRPTKIQALVRICVPISPDQGSSIDLFEKPRYNFT